MPSTLDHIQHLVEKIGPRGSTTAKEEKAARYAERMLKQFGLKPVVEPFTSARSAWYPYVLFTGLILLGVLSLWLFGHWGAVFALALGLLALISVLLELAFRSNPLRWILPKGRSQNAWAKIAPRQSVKEQVVLIGHLDSHRTPLAMKNDTWTRIFSTLVPLGLGCTVFLLALFVLEIVTPQPLWQWLALPFSLVVAGLFALTLQADFTPYSPGANDNATGAAIVLSLAERLKKSPLERTQVWAVLSGCEEVGCYGADAFARAHKAELGKPVWIAIDGAGGKQAKPAYQTSETFLLNTRSDPELVSLAGKVAATCPELCAVPYAFRGAYTEGAIGAKHGFRVLTLTAAAQKGAMPEWHRPTDTIKNLDLQVVQGTETFLWELLHVLDGSQSTAS